MVFIIYHVILLYFGHNKYGSSVIDLSVIWLWYFLQSLICLSASVCHLCVICCLCLSSAKLMSSACLSSVCLSVPTLCGISHGAVLHQDGVERLVLFVGEVIHSHLVDPRVTRLTLRVPPIDDTCVEVSVKHNVTDDTCVKYLSNTM